MNIFTFSFPICSPAKPVKKVTVHEDEEEEDDEDDEDEEEDEEEEEEEEEEEGDEKATAAEKQKAKKSKPVEKEEAVIMDRFCIALYILHKKWTHCTALYTFSCGHNQQADYILHVTF